MVCDINSVRRSDLILRSRYIGLETEIYQLEEYRFAIYCKNYRGNFARLSAYFANSIRRAGTWVELTSERPKNYLLKLEPISLSNVVDEFKGAYITQADIENAIIDRFPDVDIRKINTIEGLEFSIKVEVAPETPQELIDEMETVLSNIDFGTDRVEVCYSSSDESKAEEPYKQSPDVMQLGIDKQLPFTVDEAEYWFANADRIYNGKLTRSHMPKIYSQTTSCCLDCSNHNPVNIRSVLLLYNIIYLILPLKDEFEAFLEEQNLNRKELLSLAEMGKVTFILSNLESRYDQQFLLDLYHCNSLSIIGRRGINTIVAAFLTETRSNFLSHFPGVADTARAVRELAEKSDDPALRTIENLLSWPIAEPASSFTLLNSHGPLALGLMGLDRILQPSFDRNGAQSFNDLSMLLHFTGSTVFLSSAFNSTLFLSEFDGNTSFKQGLHAASSLISDLLQLYWYDTEAAQNIQFLRNQSFSEKQAISLFECKQNVSAVKIAEISEKYKTFDGFKQIVDHLGQMDEPERKTQITQYNDILVDLASVPPIASKLDFILSGSSFLPLPYMATLISAATSWARGKINDTEFMREKAELKRIESYLKTTAAQYSPELAKDIYTLDKISRVAMLR